MRSVVWVLVAGMLSVSCVQALSPSDPSPWVATSGAHGIDIAGMDETIGPGDDFDGYANGGWNRFTQIPADRPGYNVFVQIYDKVERRTAELIRDTDEGHPEAGTDARRIADYFAAFMNQARIEKNGLDPLKPGLAQIDAIASRSDLARVLGSGLRADVDPLNVTQFQTDRLFGLFVAQGLEDPSHNMAYLLQGGLGLPDRDYYLSADPAMTGFRAKYRAYIGDLIKLAGVTDTDAKAGAIFELEMKIARAQASIRDTQDVHKVGKPWPIAAFATNAPGMDWTEYFKAAGLDRQQQIVAWQPGAASRLSDLVASEPLQTWKDYLVFHLIDENAASLPRALSDLAFAFHGHSLEGTPIQRERWRRAVSLTNADLGDAVGQLYVARYFPATSRAQVTQMVDNLIAAFDERMDGLDWMTPATRARAKAKLSTLRVGVGFPDSWRDYSTLEIRRDDPVGNHLRAESFEYHHQLAKLGHSVDRDEWWLRPQTVNAVNLPLQNALNFPAGILDAPFFDPEADAASNYGAIGAIIGHEISHSFDNTGAEFDGDGRLANWWTPADLAHFKAATARLVAQYSAYEALPGLRINGEQTLGENIADVSGLTIAYAAYHKSLGNKPASLIHGLTGDQRFFVAFAQAWRDKTRVAAMREQLATDGHAPSRFRAQTVRNVDGWYEAFSLKPGDSLYLAPDARVRIW